MALKNSLTPASELSVCDLSKSDCKTFPLDSRSEIGELCLSASYFARFLFFLLNFHLSFSSMIM